MKYLTVLWLLLLAIVVQAAPKFSIINSHLPKWTTEVVDTAPSGSLTCDTELSSTADPVYNTGPCDQYNRCDAPVSFVETALGSYFMHAKVLADGCFEELDAINQSFEGFGITKTTETTPNDGKGIWFQAWPDSGQNSGTPTWLVVTIYYEGLLRAWNSEASDPQQNRGYASGELTVEIRKASGGEVLWANTFRGANALMEGNPSFPFYDPPEESYKRVETQTFKLATTAGTQFYLYIKTELDAQSQRVTLGDVGASGRSSLLWWVSLDMEPRIVE